jgi:hypothetical protein
MSYCAYYLVNRLADKGDFWSWLSEPNSKWAIISQYLGENYKVLPAAEMQNRLQEGLLNQRLKVVDSQTLVGEKCDASNRRLRQEIGHESIVSAFGLKTSKARRHYQETNGVRSEA